MREDSRVSRTVTDCNRYWQTRGMSGTSLAAPAESSAPAMPSLGEPCVLLKLGEIVLKGANRKQFERLLDANIRRAMDDLGIGVRLWHRYGVILLRAADDGLTEAEAVAAADKVAERVRDIMGVSRVCRAVRVAKEPAAAIDAAVALMAGKSGSFAVRPRRRDKRFPLTSAELATQIGTRVQQEYGYPVNLKHPDVTVFLEVDQREVFVYTDGRPGQGGLPVGMSGRALVLMSGGIDSPVAAYRAGVGVQGLWADAPARPVPVRITVVRGGVRQNPAAPGGIRRKPFADRGAAPAHAQDGRGACRPPRRGGAGHRGFAGPGEQPDPGQPDRARRRRAPADPAPADRPGQGGDHGGGAPDPHARAVGAARPGLLHAADAPARGDPGAGR